MSLWRGLHDLAALHLFVFLGFYIYGVVRTLVRRAHGRAQKGVEVHGLSVSFLKPLHGLDPSLESNLESFAMLETVSQFEVLLLVDDEKDPAHGVASAVARRHPERVRVIVGTTQNIANLKIASLMHGLPHARYPLLWMTDSNVETSDAHFRAHLTSWLEAQAGEPRPTLIHAPIVGIGGTGWGARCERMQLSSYNNVTHEMAQIANRQVVVGKSLLVHREHLAALGGFEAFADATGEDHMMGDAFRTAGVVRYSWEATRQLLGTNVTLRDFFERQRRWAALRRQMMPGSFFGLEHITYFGVPLAFALMGLLPWHWIAFGLFIKAMGDGILFAVYSRQAPSVLDLIFLPVKELLLIAAWATAMVSRQVTWRGRSLRVE